ncbi:MAG: LPS-assembly protein LptD [Candidatus Omnitrophica bacterium]|nr:LPS-assembly protein LptD [Candidatus Omnitrophota bacterium]
MGPIQGAVLALFLLPAFLGAPLAGAEEAQEEGGGPPVECEADVVTFLSDEQKVVGQGHVMVTSERFLLTCDYAEVYLQTKDVFARGNVILQEDDNEYRGEEMRYNFDTKLGTVKNGEVASFSKLAYGKTPFGEKTSASTFNVKEGYITTCDFAVPHYSVAARTIDIYWDDKIVSRNAKFKLFDYPIAWLPYYIHYFHRPSVIVTPGKNKDFGVFVLTSWGYWINDNLQGRLNLDYRERLGAGGGVDLDYRTPNLGAGRIETYYARERSRHFEQDLKAEDERWRTRLRHKWLVDDWTTVEAELFKQSDADFTQDYFEDEFQEEASPASFVSLTHAQEGNKLFFNFLKRANRYESVTEHLPELTLSMDPRPLWFEKLLYEGSTSMINFNEKSVGAVEETIPRPSLSTTSDSDVVKWDYFQQMTYTQRLFRWLDVSPRANYRVDWWSKEARGEDNIHRTGFGTGVGASTRIQRMFDLYTNFLGLNINRLRHLVKPSMDYAYLRRPSVGAGRLIQGGAGSAGSSSVVFTLDNVLQTKRLGEADETAEGPQPPSRPMVNVNVADLELKTTYTINPEGDYSKFSNIAGLLELRPYPWLLSEMRAEYDHIQDRIDTYRLDVMLDRKRMDLGLGYAYTVDAASDLTTEIGYQISRTWFFRFFSRFDLRGGGWPEKEYTLEYEMHDFILSFNYNLKESESVWIVIEPKAFPGNNLFKFSTSYHAPKLGRNYGGQGPKPIVPVEGGTEDTTP